jgi:DNA polymerase-3 subunit delta'
MRPYEARVRVVVISDAQSMNPEAGNALLKMLEEPPGQTVLILTTDQASDLLPTIVSRCQQIRFKPISRRRLEEMLVETTGRDPAEARIIATMSNGSFTDAVEMSRTVWLAQRNWIIREVESLDGRSVDRLLAFSERLAADKEMLPKALDVMMSWLRDLAVYAHRPQNLINADLADRIQKYSRTFTLEAVMDKIGAIQRAQRDIAANANVRLTTETLILRLSRTKDSAYGSGRTAAAGWLQ